MWIIFAVSFRKSTSLVSLSPLVLFPLSHTVLCVVLFFPGSTSSEAITLAATRLWPEISKEPGQAASTAGKAAPRLISLSPSIMHLPPKTFPPFHKVCLVCACNPQTRHWNRNDGHRQSPERGRTDARKNTSESKVLSSCFQLFMIWCKMSTNYTWKGPSSQLWSHAPSYALMHAHAYGFE